MSALIVLTFVFLIQGYDVFKKLLGRAKWLSATILVVCAFGTPGEYLPLSPEIISPTYEGLSLAFQQLLRLYLMLGALSLLLGTTSREQCIYGIYVLLQPMCLFQISPERFSARLWLTLHYVETSPPRTLYEVLKNGFRHDADQSNLISHEQITIQRQLFSKSDAMILAGALAVLCLL